MSKPDDYLLFEELQGILKTNPFSLADFLDELLELGVPQWKNSQGNREMLWKDWIRWWLTTEAKLLNLKIQDELYIVESGPWQGEYITERDLERAGLSRSLSRLIAHIAICNDLLSFRESGIGYSPDDHYFEWKPLILWWSDMGFKLIFIELRHMFGFMPEPMEAGKLVVL